MTPLDALVELLARIAVKLLAFVGAYYAGRRDARQQDYAAALEAANRALAWKADHPVAPPGPGGVADDFRVREPGRRIIRLPPDDPRPPGA